jgi:hypothetical protein
MGLAAVIVGCSIGGVAIANPVVTAKVWRSSLLERPQRVAQTALVWILPGAFVVVGHLLRDPLKPRPAIEGDSTLSRDEGYVDHDPALFTHGPDSGHHD